ncbi:MAG: hypothetical protein JWP88_639 [Flaviaesturariibacter sp.]|nr:hypothetical protein [Flaviaesturariibacter sp.]
MQPQITPEWIMQTVATGKPFTLLLLVNGKALPKDQMEAGQLQMGHLTHLFTLEREGKASIFGPISNNEKYGGLIIFNTVDKEQIKEWMAEDPFVKGGHFTYELLDWFTIPGQKIPIG